MKIEYLILRKIHSFDTERGTHEYHFEMTYNGGKLFTAPNDNTFSVSKEFYNSKEAGDTVTMILS